MTAYQVAVILLYDEDGRMLLQHRTDDAPTFPSYWALFGGGIEPGETPEQAVCRECLEELGYTLGAPQLFGVNSLRHGDDDYRIFAFVERYSGAPLTLGEGQGMGWFLHEEMEGLLMNDHDKRFVRELAEALSAGR